MKRLYFERNDWQMTEKKPDLRFKGENRFSRRVTGRLQLLSDTQCESRSRVVVKFDMSDEDDGEEGAYCVFPVVGVLCCTPVCWHT